MPGKHGGGGTQNDIVKVDPDAVPGLRSAFADALARVDRQLELAEAELRVKAWAKDPVSQGAAILFNDRSVESDRSAVDTLRAYRTQLDAAVQNLDKTAQQYDKTDGDNVHGVGRNEG
ncbi:PE domain-containing protein [Actinophytocola glycyrrhizae]|uniref:PE domain-containing protein n=1 Tax=Actinophytocola glycyrrhizae TaxID=2044873 RepID=A0ABV9RYR8_9PSEU